MDDLALRQLNGVEDEEEALRQALALSMGEASGAQDATGNDAHAYGSDSPDARSRVHVRSLSDATTASTASTASAASPPKPANNDAASPDRASNCANRDAPTSLNEATVAAVAPTTAITTTTTTSTPAMSLLGLDRKAMEAERLARRQKALEAQQAQSATKIDAPGNFDGAQDDGSAAKKDSNHLAQSWQLHTSPAKKRKAEDEVIVIDDDDDEEDEDGNQKKQTHHVDAPAARRQKLDPETAKDKGKSAAAPSPQILAPPSQAGATAASTTGFASASASTSSPKTSLPFAKGVVKKTWVRGQQRQGNDITLDEMWQKDTLDLAVLSSFQWDEDWMLSKLDIRKTRVMLIAYAVDERQKEQMQTNSRGSNIRFCFPPMQTMGCMHSKLQLLRFSGHLRIAVPTGNLVPYDWGETGTLENMVFLIDLPKLPKGSSAESTGTPFLEDLSYFLTAQGVDAAMVKSLRNYDFSETAKYAFVHSIAGSHMDESWKRTGYSGLGRAVKAMGWESSDPIQLDYITASIGSISDDLLNALYYACQGDLGLKELGSRTSKPRGGKGKSIAASSAAPSTPNSPKNRLRLYFPSEETVDSSLGGRNKAGTICFQKKWWEAPTFPQSILRDVQSVRKGVLLHTKLLLVRTGDGAQGNGSDQAARPRGWAYVGSANMSESAWGRLVKDRATGKTKMTCRNWECGVLVPAPDESNNGQTVSATMEEDAKMFDVFRNALPVPISAPGMKYIVDSSQVAEKRPWFFMEA